MSEPLPPGRYYTGGPCTGRPELTAADRAAVRALVEHLRRVNAALDRRDQEEDTGG
jgi:hypothetical protein